MVLFSNLGKRTPEVKWPAWLQNPETRASHIAIAIITVIIFIVALVILPWAIFRSGGAASSMPADEANNANFNINNNLTTYVDMDNALVDPTIMSEQVNPGGLRWIANMERIVSKDGKFDLRLTIDGNAEMWSHINGEDKRVWESKTTNSTSPAQRFLLGVEGVCYLLRDDGSRVKSNESKEFWVSPNQFPPYFTKGNRMFFVQAPFILEFYEHGLVLYAIDKANTKITGTSQYKIPIWWICGTNPGVPPPGILTDWCTATPATSVPVRCSC